MPIHDWTKVPAGWFHDFHQVWSVEIRNSLNRGVLPRGYAALVEQRVGGPEPDVIAVEISGHHHGPDSNVAVLEQPRVRVVQHLTDGSGRYSEKANRIVIRGARNDVVAVIEIVSPGNKNSRAALKSFAEKSVAFLRHGIHLLVVDLFPTSKRDPEGIHDVISQEFGGPDDFTLPPDAPLTLVSYQAIPGDVTAYIEPVAIGQALPEMPLFLTPEAHIRVPLETTYMASWSVCPDMIRSAIEG